MFSHLRFCHITETANGTSDKGTMLYWSRLILRRDHWVGFKLHAAWKLSQTCICVSSDLDEQESVVAQKTKGRKWDYTINYLCSHKFKFNSFVCPSAVPNRTFLVPNLLQSVGAVLETAYSTITRTGSDISRYWEGLRVSALASEGLGLG